MQILKGSFNGTGAAAYLCLGAIPYRFVLQNVEVATNPETIEWDEMMLVENTCYAGIYIKGSDGVRTKLTTTGVVPYEGGDLMTASNQTSVAYGEGIYLGWDLKDYRADYTYGSGTQGTPLNQWTLGNSGNRTGNWNVAKVASGAKIGAGSKISIKENSSGLVKKSAVVAITSDGEAANEVTLSRSIGTGSITFIGGMYDLAPVALGKVTPAGIALGSETTVNVNDNMLTFKAWVD
jgi:hypothetical protein